MNIKPITQKQAQEWWKAKVPLHWRYRWGTQFGLEWKRFDPWRSPLVQAKESCPRTMMFGVEVE